MTLNNDKDPTNNYNPITFAQNFIKRYYTVLSFASFWENDTILTATALLAGIITLKIL